jgi:ribosomal protein S18 acetylase RimI-like enzyme
MTGASRSTPADLVLRPMRPADVPAAERLCRASRWNQTAREWELFLGVAGDHCLVAELDGRVVGTAVTTVYGEAVAWIAMVLVDPAQRGRGIGRTLLGRAIASAPAGCTPSLDATPAGRGLYLTLGFSDEYELTRFRGDVTREPVVTGTASGRRVQVAAADDLDEIVELDRRTFGAERRDVLEWYWQGAPEGVWVSRDALDTSGDASITGFALSRSGHDADHVGPIVACSTSEAIAHASTALSSASARSVILDVPNQHTEFREWLMTRGFAVERPLTRMRRGEPPPARPDRQFAIAGPELG